jgi:Tfp pilus assembly protein PilV
VAGTLTDAVKARRDATRSVAGTEEGFGLIEVVIALTILTVIFLAVAWLLISSLSTAQVAKQRSAAASIMLQQDASLEQLPTILPTAVAGWSPTWSSAQILAAAQSYVSNLYNGTVEQVANGSNGSSTNYTVTTTTSGGTATQVNGVTTQLMNVELSVSWKSAVNPAQTQLVTNTVQVPIQ